MQPERDMLWIRPMPSRHLTVKKDVRTRFSPAPVWKALTFNPDMFDAILTHMHTLQFPFLNNANTSASSNSSFSAFLTSAGKKVAAAGLDTSRLSCDVAFRCVGLVIMGEGTIPGS